MARYRSSIDLGAFLGVRFLNAQVGEDGSSVQGIFIPTGINGIEVKPDTRPDGKCNQSKLRAFLNFQQRSCNASYLQFIRNRIISAGETITPFNVPAWHQCYILPEEKRTKIRQALKKRILAEHPELAGQEDVRGTDLSKQISRLMPFQMGDSFLIDDSTAAPQAAAPTPPAVTIANFSTAPVTDSSADWDGDCPF